MVGVPGKSKGCATCRRRKVKCDLRKPHCNRCQQSKLTCEGYARFPVFIHRTASGLQKRSSLEEVKPPTLRSDIPDAQTLGEAPRMRDIRSPVVEAVRFTSWFREAFARSPPSKYALQNPSFWLDKVMGLTVTKPFLQTALLAVSMARCGKVHQNQHMLHQSRWLYSQALGRLKVALSDDRLALHDDTLATTTLMVLYELFDSTLAPGEGWSRHIEGQLRLMQHRGSIRHTGVIPLAILEHARYIIMMRCLMQRQSCFLAEDAWLHDPWQGRDKGIEQRVFDYGFRLAGIFERSDQLFGQEEDAESLIAILNECIEVDARIGELRDIIIKLPISTPVRSAFSHSSNEPIHLSPATLMLSITAMAIQLGACGTGSLILQRTIHLLATSPVVPDLALAHLSQATQAALPLRRRRQLLSFAILNDIAECLALRIGAVGASRLLFPLSMAREQFRSSDPEYQKSNLLLDELIRQSAPFRTLFNPGESRLRETILQMEQREGRPWMKTSIRLK